MFFLPRSPRSAPACFSPAPRSARALRSRAWRSDLKGRVAQAAARPGDLFLLHAGVYAEGTWAVEHHGAADRPIIYRGAGDGETILDGGGRERLVSAERAQHVWLEGLTLRNAFALVVVDGGSHTPVHWRRRETRAVVTNNRERGAQARRAAPDRVKSASYAD